MPNFSGVWDLKDQVQAIAAGRWTGVPTFELYSWGDNDLGQVGDGSKFKRSSPVQVGTDTNWSQVSGGGQFNIALKSDGSLWSWGWNFVGGLGDNTTLDKSSPIQVGALTDWSQVSNAARQAMAIKNNGTLWSWGWNNYGQLGQNNRTDLSSPVQVGALTNWSQISCGQQESSAIKTDGTLWGWGRNLNGQVGDSTIIARSSPVQIGVLTTWAQVSAGNFQTAAVKTDGTLWTWGINNSGILGLNDINTQRSSPVQVGALTNWSQVSAGSESMAAIKTDGTLWSWGKNNYGQLGQNNRTNRSSPVQVGALTTWSLVSSGYSYHMAATKTDKTIWTWGRNNYGQLGQNDRVNRSSPTQVGAFANWTFVSARRKDGIITIVSGITN